MSEFEIMRQKRIIAKQPKKYRGFIDDLRELGERIRSFIKENLRRKRDQNGSME